MDKLHYLELFEIMYSSNDETSRRQALKFLTHAAKHISAQEVSIIVSKYPLALNYLSAEKITILGFTDLENHVRTIFEKYKDDVRELHSNLESIARKYIKLDVEYADYDYKKEINYIMNSIGTAIKIHGITDDLVKLYYDRIPKRYFTPYFTVCLADNYKSIGHENDKHRQVIDTSHDKFREIVECVYAKESNDEKCSTCVHRIIRLAGELCYDEELAKKENNYYTQIDIFLP